MHSFACKYYFLIAILKGEPRRFEPRHGKQANPVETFLLSAIIHVILIGVVVTVLVTCADGLSSNP
jgi:hypothetical protein